MNIDIEKITKLVAEKSNITEEQAHKAIVAVFEELKGKLPEFGTLLKDKMPEFDKLVKELPFAGVKR